MKHKYINKLALVSTLFTTVLVSSFAGQSAYAKDLNSILKIGNAGIPKVIDPQRMGGTWERMISFNMFLGLTTLDAKGKTIPGLARKWEVKNNGKTFIFHLRNGLQWSDGKPLTADDVVFSYRYLLDVKTAHKYASIMYLIANAKEVNTGKKPLNSLGVKKIDDLTVEFDLATPAPFFAELQTGLQASIIPKHVVEKYGDKWARDDHIVSSGPYKMVKSTGFSVITLTKNNKFFDAKNVKIQNVVFNSQEDEGALRKRFQSGSVDWVNRFDTSNYDIYNKQMPGTALVAPYQGVEYLAFNVEKKPYDQANLRQALSMSVNRKALIKSVLKVNTPAYSFLPANLRGTSKPNNVYWSSWSMSKRISTAKKIIAKLGYSRKHPLSVKVSYNTSEEHRKILVAIASFWKKIGVKVQLSNSDVTSHYNSMANKKFEIARAGWIAPYNDPYAIFFVLHGKVGAAYNYSGYDNPVYNKFMNQSLSELNMKKRDKIFHSAEGKLMQDMPVIPLYFYTSSNLKSKKLQGYYSNAVDVHPVRYMYFVK